MILQRKNIFYWSQTYLWVDTFTLGKKQIKEQIILILSKVSVQSFNDLFNTY